MPDKIGNLLHGSLSHFGVDKEARAAFVCHQYNALLSELYKKKFTSRVEAKTYRSQELHVWVESSVWAQELRLRQDELMREFKKRHPQDPIVRVRYVVGTVESRDSDSFEPLD